MLMRNLFLVCMTMAGTTSYAADVARSVDASQFDVSGVKLGMSPAEAVAAASSKLQIDKRSVEFDKFPQLNEVTRSKEPRYFTAAHGTSKLTVYFFPKIPTDKSNPMLVGLVKYEMIWTPENAQSMKMAALEKYGQPSNGTMDLDSQYGTMDSQWCLQPNKNLRFGCLDFEGPKLQFQFYDASNASHVSIQLQDSTYQKAVNDFIWYKSQSSKPVF